MLKQNSEISCDTPLHPEALVGLKLFNQREYFEAHEALEYAWMAEKNPVRDLYRAILQIAVAYYHVKNGNYRSARKMFLRCKKWLVHFPDVCKGINLKKLRKDYLAVEENVIRLGPDRIGMINPADFQPIEYELIK